MIVLPTGRIEKGHYVKKEIEMYICSVCGKEYESKFDAMDCEKKHKEDKKIMDLEYATKFKIKNEHLKLLRRMYVDWDDSEFGAPYIDPKRPYGNSEVIDDIAKIIGFKKNKKNFDSDVEEWTDKAYNKMYWLHREMMIVLQIVLATGRIEKGHYIKKEKYDDLSWMKANGKGNIIPPTKVGGF